jgi:multiple sugar transport system substrate-binding protein
MKKLISLLLLFTMLVPMLSFVGCHKRRSNSAFQIPDEFDTSKSYEITFWAKNENNATQREVYANAVAEFQKLYPNIKVTLRNFTDYGEIYNNVITNISTNTTPNVCITYPDHIATYMQGENIVVPLEKLMNNEKYGLGGTELKFDSPTLEQMIEKFLNEGKINGVQYALPFMRSTEVCYVNKDFVEALGFTLPKILTWEFVWKVSEYALSLGKDASGNYIANGQKTLIPFIYKSTDNMMISMLKQLNAPYSKDDGTVEILNDKTKSLLYEIAGHAKSGAFSTFKISSYPGNFLNAGQCIFAIDSTAGSTWMGADAPLVDIPDDKRVDFETVVMEIPQFDAENPQMISQGPSLCIFNKEDSGEVLASWLFAQFLLTNEIQIAYSQTEGYVPVTSKAQESAEYQDYLNRAGENNNLYYKIKIDSTKLLIENTENSFTTPVFNGSASLRDAAGSLIELTVSSAAKGRVVDEDFMELLYSRVVSLHKLDQIRTNRVIQKNDLAEMPNESKFLIGTLIFIWLGIGTYFGYSIIKKKKSRKY